MKETEMNKIKTQLWSHLQYLIGRIDSLRDEGHSVDKFSWIGQQYLFCKSEIMFWKELTS